MALTIKHALRLLGFSALGGAFGLAAAVLAAPDKTPDPQVYEQLVLFADVLERVQNDYIEETESPELVSEAMNGLLKALDPHSRYEPPVEYQEKQENAKREYGGLGIEVSMDDDAVLIGYVNPGAPAARAGLKSGDRITHVEGDSVAGKTLSKAVEKMRGLAGDPIKITVKSEGRMPREITIIREVIRGRAVRHRLLDEGPGYMYLETFHNDSIGKDVGEAIDLLSAEAGGVLPGLIIDIRNNGGGFLNASVDVSGHFLNGGEVLSVRGRQKDDISRYHAERGEKLPGTPIIVLINGNSASASEIVAGALQDRGRALIVGTPSFGKGSVQSVYPLRGGSEGALRLTTARYFTPSGKSIQGLGITPDVWVESFPDTGKKRIRLNESSLPNTLDKIIMKTEGENTRAEPTDIIYPPEDWPKTKDFQLEQAIELLQASDFKDRLAMAYGE